MSQTDIAVSSSVRREVFDASFTGETVTVKDMIDLAGVSKVTLLKILDTAGLSPVGKVVSGGRGRPAALFDRDAFMAIMADRKSAKVSKVKDTVSADAVAEPDTVEAETGEVRTMTVDEINAALSAAE